jgi:hypothetical protein
MHELAKGILLAMTAALGLSISACASTRAQELVALPNGYALQPDKSAESEIVGRNGHAIVPAPIAAYAVSGNVVAGALGMPSPESRLYTDDLAFTGRPETRYFVLDTATGKLETNLDEAAWKSALKQLNVPSDFHIYAPLKW